MLSPLLTKVPTSAPVEPSNSFTLPSENIDR